MKYTAINANRERYLRAKETGHIQKEVLIAKQIQEQTGCTWDEAIRAAYESLYGEVL